jgi:hypothetical protein
MRSSVEDAADPAAVDAAQADLDRFQGRFTVLLAREQGVVVDPAVVAGNRGARALEVIAVAITGSVGSPARCLRVPC